MIDNDNMPDILPLLVLANDAGHAARLADVRQANRDGMERAQGVLELCRYSLSAPAVVDAKFTIDSVGDA